ncbi:MAG: hydrogenase maturation protease [Verrucomicrobiia bacterium]|jgi:hydrogenase maturation protease
MKALVLGYGNRSRNDDGVGWFVVERLAELELPGVELLTSHQLDIDHAEVISRFDTVVFVDAAVPQSPRPMARTLVKPNFRGHAVAHYLTPSDLLELAVTLFGHAPRAFLFSIRGHDFNFGTTLSAPTECAAREAVRQISPLVLPLTEQGARGWESEAAHA